MKMGGGGGGGGGKGKIRLRYSMILKWKKVLFVSTFHLERRAVKVESVIQVANIA